MEAEVQDLYDAGKKMYDQAKAMDETCALIIKAGEKKKKKYSTGKKEYEPEPDLPGDHVPQ